MAENLAQMGTYTLQDIARITNSTVSSVIDKLSGKNVNLLVERSIERKLKGLISSNIAVSIAGPHSCGKTTIAIHAAESMGFDVIRISCGGMTSSTDILSKIGYRMHNPSFCIILDDVDTVSSGMREVIDAFPAGGAKCVIISRAKQKVKIPSIYVNNFTRDELLSIAELNFPGKDRKYYLERFDANPRVFFNNVENDIIVRSIAETSSVSPMALAIKVISGFATMEDVDNCKSWYWAFQILATNAAKIWSGEDLELALDLLEYANKGGDAKYKKSILLQLPKSRARPRLVNAKVAFKEPKKDENKPPILRKGKIKVKGVKNTKKVFKQKSLLDMVNGW